MTRRPIPQFEASPWANDEQLSFRWAMMRRSEVPERGEPYKVQWRVLQTPWFAVHVHRFNTPDPRATFHDHPATLVSFVLRGGYDEVRVDKGVRRIRRLNVIRASAAHYIERLHRTPTWTLVLVGPRRRRWGYIRPIDGGYSWTRSDLDQHAIGRRP